MEPMKKLSVAQAEPTMIRGVIVALLTVLGALGLSWAADVSEETLTALTVLAALVIPLVQAAWTRFAVTPDAKVLARVTSKGAVVAGDAAIEPTGSDVSRAGPDTFDQVVAEVAVNPNLLP